MPSDSKSSCCCVMTLDDLDSRHETCNFHVVVGMLENIEVIVSIVNKLIKDIILKFL